MNDIEAAIQLTEDQRKLRDRFVEFYLRDYDPVQAAVKCGYSIGYAREYGPRFMQEPYTLARIEEREQALGRTEADVMRVRNIAILYREAHNMSSSGAARVAAVIALNKMHGFEAPTKTTTEVNLTSKGPDLSHLTVEELEQLKQKIYAPASAPAK